MLAFNKLMKSLFFLFFPLGSPSLGRAKVSISNLCRAFQHLVNLSCQIINLETVLCMCIDRQFQEKKKKVRRMLAA